MVADLILTPRRTTCSARAARVSPPPFSVRIALHWVKSKEIGAIVREGTAKELKSDPEVQRAYLGELS